MTGIPAPPADFARLHLLLEEISAGALLRLTWRTAAAALAFRHESRFRFDAPTRSFGVMYAAFDLETAFAEAVLRDKPAAAGTLHQVPLDYDDIAGRCVVTFAEGPARRPLRLIKLYDNGLAAARTDNRLATVDDYALTQLWAEAFHRHPVNADGIVYMSRYMGARKSVALFDRCAPAIAVEREIPLLEHPRLPGLLDIFGVAIDPPESAGTA